MADYEAHEQRRYTALLVQHPRIRRLADLRRILGTTQTLAKLSGSPRPWRAERCEVLAPRNLYPSHRREDDARRTDNGWHGHDVYLAVREGDGDACFGLIASPYTQLLKRMATALRDGLDGPAPRYLAVNMRTVYAALAEGASGLLATKVTMQMLNEPGLELVSLSGRNPLNSNLHAAIEHVASPYSIRTEVVGSDNQCRVNADRHGNLWWYQAEESRFPRALDFIEHLRDWSALNPVRNLPLSRAEDPEDE
jgi:hypothetical protein